MNLEFNFEKTKIMKFNSHLRKSDGLLNRPLVIDDHSVQFVNIFKYLGYMITDNLSNNEDIVRVKREFYSEFNSIQQISFIYL